MNLNHKKLFLIIFILFCVSSAWSGGFEDTKKLAEQGNKNSQNNLGLFYALGVKGAPQNDKLAYVWLSLAASQGDKDVIRNRDVCAKKLTPKQLGEAQELASKIQDKIDNLSK